MGVVQLPDDLKNVIERQVAEGRATSEAEFLADAVLRHAAALEADEEAILAAAADGIADIEAGRFELISGPQGLRRLDAELGAWLDRLEADPDASRFRETESFVCREKKVCSFLKKRTKKLLRRKDIFC